MLPLCDIFPEASLLSLSCLIHTWVANGVHSLIWTGGVPTPPARPPRMESGVLVDGSRSCQEAVLPELRQVGDQPSPPPGASDSHLPSNAQASSWLQSGERREGPKGGGNRAEVQNGGQKCSTACGHQLRRELFSKGVRFQIILTP
jgi:hypothetical protein